MSDLYFQEHNIQHDSNGNRRQNIGNMTNNGEIFTGFFAPGAPMNPHNDLDAFDSLANQIPDDFMEHLRDAVMRYTEYGDKSGVDQKFLDALDRIPKKQLKSSDECAICATRFLDHDYPLVVRLPCNSKHQFDLECIAPWLKENSTCPMCRRDFNQKRPQEPLEDSEEDDTIDAMYG